MFLVLSRAIRSMWRDCPWRTFIGHYMTQATESLARFYHPLHDAAGNVVSHVAVHRGGGPCGDGIGGGSH